MVDQTEPHDIFTIWKCFSSNMLLLWWEIIDLSVIGSDVWNKALHHLDQSWEMTEALTSKTTYWISIASWYYFTWKVCCFVNSGTDWRADFVSTALSKPTWDWCIHYFRRFWNVSKRICKEKRVSSATGHFNFLEETGICVDFDGLCGQKR